MWRRFDPDEPAREPLWRAERPHSPVRRILRKLDLPLGEGPAPILLSGITGSGKSTELLRIREARTAKDLVIYLDLLKHFQAIGDMDALQRLEAWEVVYQAGLAVLAAAAQILPYPVPADMIDRMRKAWERAADATEVPRPVELDIGRIASGMVAAGAVLLPLAGLPAEASVTMAAGAGALRAVADGVRRIIPIGLTKKTLPDQNEALESLIGSVNLIIGHVQTHHRRVLLVIDGLDWVRDEERQLALFDRSELLGRLACPAVICAPYTLLSSPRARNLRRFNDFVLANEPVLDREQPDHIGPGVVFFEEVYHLRTADLGAPELIAPELLRRLAYFSGGRARDFTKLVRELAERGLAEELPGATAAAVEDVIAEAQKACQRGLHAGHARVLRQAMADPYRLPEDPLAQRLIEWARLLPFDNETPWFHPHPLLRKRFLSQAGSPA